MENAIKIEEYIIPYKVNYNNKLKYMRITVSAYGIKVSTRRGVSKDIIEKFILSKSKWILEHYVKLKEQSYIILKKMWIDEQYLLYMGSKYKVIISESSKLKCKIEFHNSEFEIEVPRNIIGNERISVIENEIEQWYRKEAKRIISEKLIFYSREIGVTYNLFRIKEQKTRWGSCSVRKNLNFNWKIIMAPESVMDYIIIHELCHLIHFNHSNEFWKLVSVYIPDYREQAEWLKNNGISLHI